MHTNPFLDLGERIRAKEAQRGLARDEYSYREWLLDCVKFNSYMDRLSDGPVKDKAPLLELAESIRDEKDSIASQTR